MNLSIDKSKTLDRATIHNVGSSILEKCKSGDLSALETVMRFKAIAKIYKDNQDEFDRIARSEAETHGKEFKLLGASLKLSEVGTEYDYSVCQDEVLNTLQSNLDTAKILVDERKNYLKTLKTKLEIPDTETGELKATIYPPIKKSKSSVTVTF
jgi:hypothetical protein